MAVWRVKCEEFRIVEVEGEVEADTREDAVKKFAMLTIAGAVSPSLDDEGWLSEVVVSSTPCSGLQLEERHVIGPCSPTLDLPGLRTEDIDPYSNQWY